MWAATIRLLPSQISLDRRSGAFDASAFVYAGSRPLMVSHWAVALTWLSNQDGGCNFERCAYAARCHRRCETDPAGNGMSRGWGSSKLPATSRPGSDSRCR